MIAAGLDDGQIRKDGNRCLILTGSDQALGFDEQGSEMPGRQLLG